MLSIKTFRIFIVLLSFLGTFSFAMEDFEKNVAIQKIGKEKTNFIQKGSSLYFETLAGEYKNLKLFEVYKKDINNDWMEFTFFYGRLKKDCCGDKIIAKCFGYTDCYKGKDGYYAMNFIYGVAEETIDLDFQVDSGFICKRIVDKNKNNFQVDSLGENSRLYYFPLNEKAIEFIETLMQKKEISSSSLLYSEKKLREEKESKLIKERTKPLYDAARYLEGFDSYDATDDSSSFLKEDSSSPSSIGRGQRNLREKRRKRIEDLSPFGRTIKVKKRRSARLLNRSPKKKKK